MNFKLTNVKFFKYPINNTTVDDVFTTYGINLNEIEETLRNHDFVRKYPTGAFQEELDTQLKDLFENLFKKKGYVVRSQGDYRLKYSDKIDFKSDIFIKNPVNDKRIHIEIEFRPDSHIKDFVKFEIGYNNQLTDLGLLVVALSNKHINYRGIPLFHICKNIITELKPRCPILMIGIDGEFS